MNTSILDAMKVRCPRCKAAPGKVCKGYDRSDRSGEPLHKERHAKAPDPIENACKVHRKHTCPEETTFWGVDRCPCCGWSTSRCQGLDFDTANGIGQGLYEDHDGPVGNLGEQA